MANRFLFLFVLICVVSGWCKAQNSIKGKVVDHNNAPLPYVDIFLKGRTSRTISDEQGFFKLELDHWEDSDTLFVHALGFEQKCTPVKYFINQTTLSQITLVRKSIVLQDVEVKVRKREPKLL